MYSNKYMKMSLMMYREMKEDLKSVMYDKCMESLFNEKLNKFESHKVLIECMKELIEELNILCN